MANNQTINAGDQVTVVFPWREDEQPTAKNFFTGKVLQVVERTTHNFYVRVQGLNNLVPMDRVSAA
jgi:hypothetical protein